MANAREMLNNIPRFQEGGEVEPDPFPTIRESLAELGANPDKYEKILAKTDENLHWEKVFRPKTTLEAGAITLLAAAKQSGAEPTEYLSRLAPYFESRIQSLPDLYNVAGYVREDAPKRAVLTRTAREEKSAASTLPHELEHTLQGFDPNNLPRVKVPGRPDTLLRFAIADSFKNDLQNRLSELPEEERNKITAEHPVFGRYLSRGNELFARIRAQDMLASAKGEDFLQTEMGQKLFPTDRDRSYFIGSTLPGVPTITPPYTFESTEKNKKPLTDPNTSYARQLYNKLTAPKEYQEGGEVTDEFPEEAGAMPDQNPSEAAKRLLYYKKTAAPTPPTDIARLGKQAGLIGLGFAPGAGVADYFGKFPAVEGGTEPSAVENFQKGNYGTATLQGLGAMGDLAMAVPVAGTAIGSVMKAPRAAQKMLQELKGSRVVDQSGEPLTVYHGTNTKNLKEFDTAKKGAWFSEDPYIAEAYTRREGADAGTIVSAKINVKNPLIVPQDIDMSKRYSVEEIINRINDDNATTYVPKDFGLKPNTEVPAFEVVSSPRFIKELKKGGFDGIKAYEGGYSTWNVFDNKQITRDLTKVKSPNESTLPSSTTAKDDLAKVEAPSIMTRSGLTELSDYIKNREGGYGLRRVERAADEIPNLEKLYALDALRSAFSGDNARALMTMKPADFEKYAAPLLTNLSQQSKDNIANLKTIQGAGGFSDVPFFLVNKELAGSTGVPFVTGHEGRHRSRAMDAAGVQSGLVQFLPRAELREPFPRRSQEQYIDAIRKEMALSGNKIKPEKYYLNEADEKSFQRPAIDLPDLYANGGAVRKPK